MQKRTWRNSQFVWFFIFYHTRKLKKITDVHLFQMYTEIIIFWRRKLSAFKKEFATSLKNMQCVCVCVVTLTHKLPLLLLCVHLCLFPTEGNSLQKHDNLSMQISEPQTTTHKHERTHLWIENLRRRKARTLCSCITNAYVNLLSVHVECFYIYKSPHS